MERGWEQYFHAFPDYRIDLDEAHQDEDVVTLFGWASGSFQAKGPSWRIPAAWKAVIENERVREWMVYCDVEPMLRSMGIDRFGTG